MPNYICVTCGAQYAATQAPPERCPICEDERQYIGWNGQQWTTLEALRETHTNQIRQEEPGLTGICSEPTFAIGQRALLVEAPDGNVLWDCVSLIDDATVEAVRARGGIKAITLSHPHLFGSMVEWGHAFGAAIYVHADDCQWVMRPDPAIQFWHGETLALGDGVTVIRCGGHFPGSSVLHWAAGARGRGALLTGDTMYVVQDRRWVTFMYSYPNSIPLSAAAVGRIVSAVEPFEFDCIYGGWWGRVVASDGKAAVQRSAERYLRAIS